MVGVIIRISLALASILYQLDTIHSIVKDDPGWRMLSELVFISSSYLDNVNMMMDRLKGSLTSSCHIYTLYQNISWKMRAALS